MSGYITYQYVGDTAHPYRYELTLIVNSDAGSLFSPPNVGTIIITSGCYADTTLSLPLLPGSGMNNNIPSYDACIDASSPEYTVIEEWKYVDTIDLQGPCNNYILQCRFDCCRSSFITTGIYNFSMYLSTTLNTSFDNNTATFNSQTSHLICVNQLYTIPSMTVEPDGDFLVYEITTPLHSSFSSPTIPDSVIYDAPYYSKYPLTTDSLHPFTVGRYTGDISFYPTMQEGTGFAVEIKEYRYDSTASSYFFVSKMHKEYLLVVSASCSPGVTDGVTFSSIDTTSASVNPVQLISCGDSTITLSTYGRRIDCSSIASDGSDFILEDTSSGTSIPIISAQVNCIGYSDSVEIDIKLGQQLISGGDFLLITQKGSDSTVINNQCGFSSQPGDTIVLKFDSTITTPPTYITNQMIGSNPSIDFTCGESIIQMNMSKPIDCSSVATDGSDFSILNTISGKNVHIKSASAVNCIGGFTSLIELVVDTPLFEQADYFVTSKIGADGNTIVSSCGPDMIVNDILVVRVDTTCSGIGIAEEVLNQNISIYPNPNTGSFTLDVDVSANDSYNLIINDLLGREVYRKEGLSEETAINTNLPKGMYMALIKSTKGEIISIKKLLVE